jgi:hypothetical protein
MRLAPQKLRLLPNPRAGANRHRFLRPHHAQLVSFGAPDRIHKYAGVRVRVAEIVSAAVTPVGLLKENLVSSGSTQNLYVHWILLPRRLGMTIRIVHSYNLQAFECNSHVCVGKDSACLDLEINLSRNPNKARIRSAPMMGDSPIFAELE